MCLSSDYSLITYLHIFVYELTAISHVSFRSNNNDLLKGLHITFLFRLYDITLMYCVSDKRELTFNLIYIFQLYPRLKHIIKDLVLSSMTGKDVVYE